MSELSSDINLTKPPLDVLPAPDLQKLAGQPIEIISGRCVPSDMLGAMGANAILGYN